MSTTNLTSAMLSVRGQRADDLTRQTAGEFAEQFNLRLFPHTG